MTRSTWLRLSAATLPFLAAFTIFACSDVSGPSRTNVPHASIAFNPVFQGDAAHGVVQFEKVHILLHREDGSVALDTLVSFPAGADQIALNLQVALSAAAPASGENFTLNLEMLNAAGQVVFTAGPITVHAQEGTPLPPVDVPATYVGPGSTATSVIVSPLATTLVPQSGTDFTATAFDASNAALPGTPIVWSSLDPTVIAFPNPAIGHAVAGAARGATHVRATLLTGQTADAVVTVRPTAVAITSVSGGAQTGIAGSALPQPLVVKVIANDGLGVGGAIVTFTVVSGGGTLAQTSLTTDDQGLASTTYTLGTTAGPAVVSASAAGVAGSTATFAATSVGGPASQLSFTTQPVSSVDGANIPVVVQARDAFGNIAFAYSATVTLALDSPPSGVALQGTTSVSAVSGVASFSTKVAGSANGLHVRATGAGIAGSVLSSAFNVASGPATQLFLPTPIVQDKTGRPVHLVIQARNAAGAVDPTFAGGLLVALATKPVGGSVTVVNPPLFVAGIATADLIFSTAGSYQLLLTAPGLPQLLSAPFNIVSAAPTNIVIVSGNNQSAAPGASLPNSLVILVTDGAGDPVGGANVAWTAASGGGSILPPTTVTAVDGTTSAAWQLGATGVQTALATVAGVAPAAFNATFTVGLGQTRTWVSDTSSVWTTPANWSPAGVPGPTDNVIINAGPARNPEISSPTTINNLTLGANARLDIDPVLLTLTGNLVVGAGAIVNAPFAGIRAGVRTAAARGASRIPANAIAVANQVIDFGNIALAGAATTISATPTSTIDANLYIDEHVIAGSDLLLNGAMIAEGTTGVFDVGGFRVTEFSDFESVSGGRLSMTNPAGVLEVFGTTDFEGGSTTGLLTNGTLIVHGNFVQIGMVGILGGGLARTPADAVNHPRDPRALAMSAKARSVREKKTTLLPASARMAARNARAAARRMATSTRPSLRAAQLGAGHAPSTRLAHGPGRFASVVLDPTLHVDSYAPSGGHTTQFVNGDDNSIAIQTPGGSHFQNVTFDNGIWFLQGDATAEGNANFASSSSAELDGSGSFTVVGQVTTNATSFLEVAMLIVTRNIIGAGFIEPDDLVLSPGSTYVLSQVTNPGLFPNQVDMLADASLVTGETFEVGNAIFVDFNSNFDVNGATLQIDGGDFVTLENGRLIMDGANDLIQVGGLVDFEGGPSVISDGRIITFGGLFQGSTNDSFAASGSNVVELDGGGELLFSNPGSGAGSSHFANVHFVAQQVLELDSPVFVTGVLSADDGLGLISIVSDGMTLTVDGINVPSVSGPNQTVMRFEDVPLVVGIVGQPDAVTVLNNAIFDGFNNTVTQFTISRITGTYNFDNWQFLTPCAETLQYIFGHDGGGAPIYNFNNPSVDQSIPNGCGTTVGKDGGVVVNINIT